MKSQQTNIYGLKAVFEANPNLPLIFKLGDETINPGYHVTEIKHAVINSMDCGQGTDQWDEIIVQLLDGSALFKGEHMSCAKFTGIVSTAIESLTVDENTQTYIEFAPNNGALGKLVIDSIEQSENKVVVHLSNPTAMCKPYQRAMAAQATRNQSEPPCCEAGKPTRQSTACCENSARFKQPIDTTE